jgi:hypothetical protein
MNTNHTNHPPFSFEYLWNQTGTLNATNPRDPFIYHPFDNQSRLTLTYDGCVNYVGTGWKAYSRHDVYDRVILWRVPLIALVATTTLPALGFTSKLFTILHLIGDPIDAFSSLFYKLKLAERLAKWAMDLDKTTEMEESPIFTFSGHPDDAREGGPEGGGGLRRAQTQMQGAGKHDKQAKQQQLLIDRDKKIKRYFCDVFASIVNAYEEWHLSSEAKRAIESGL